MDRSSKREMIFKLLYSLEIQKQFEEESIQLFIENNNIIEEKDKQDIADSVKKIIENKIEIREKIAQNLKKEWTIERISKSIYLY